MNKYLVTGGAGFIGSHLVERLTKDENCRVLVLDKKWNMPNCIKKLDPMKVIYWQCDIADEREVRKYFEWFGPEYVFHLAAEARIQPSFSDPLLYYKSNVVGTLNIMEMSREAGVKRIVYSASSSAYGERREMPLKEDMLLTSQALHTYGSTKRMGEMMMKDLGCSTGGPETVCLRYFNVYGPRQPTEGEYATVIGIFLRQLKNKKPLTVVFSGEQRRDFTYVSDVVNANILAMFSTEAGKGEVINIGAGKNYSVWDVAKLVLEVPAEAGNLELQRKDMCVVIPRRRGEVRETLADISKAKELLGWKPDVSLEEGIEFARREYFS